MCMSVQCVHGTQGEPGNEAMSMAYLHFWCLFMSMYYSWMWQMSRNDKNVYPYLLSFKLGTQTILEMYYLLQWHNDHLNCLLGSISVADLRGVRGCKCTHLWRLVMYFCVHICTSPSYTAVTCSNNNQAQLHTHISVPYWSPDVCLGLELLPDIQFGLPAILLARTMTIITCVINAFTSRKWAWQPKNFRTHFAHPEPPFKSATVFHHIRYIFSSHLKQKYTSPLSYKHCKLKWEKVVTKCDGRY